MGRSSAASIQPAPRRFPGDVPNARSNAESTLSSIKRVFGDTLGSKTRAAQVYERLLRVIAYNIVCVVDSIFRVWRRCTGV